MYQWRKDIAEWRMSNTLYLSVPFTWLLPRARQIAQQSRLRVIVGGPAVELMPDYLADVSRRGESPVPPLRMHNPLATRTTLGCPNACPFCLNADRDFEELTDWDVLPVLCDDNFLAASRAHFDSVVDRLKILPMVDFNQGLEAALFTDYVADRLAELPLLRLRFAWDDVRNEAAVMDAIVRAKDRGFTDIRCYVLIGFKDTPADARYRCESLKAQGVQSAPMRYQPLDCLVKDSHLADNWTSREIARFQRYWFRQNWGAAGIPYDEFCQKPSVGQESLFNPTTEVVQNAEEDIADRMAEGPRPEGGPGQSAHSGVR